ncbi:MAG: hypothetical protein K6F31_10525 [Acetatifactor sp.]|nr:hypothetical protein [Acetatifactor sp.]
MIYPKGKVIVCLKGEDLMNEHEILREIGKLEDGIKQVLSELVMLRSAVPQDAVLRAARHGNGYQYFQRTKGSKDNGDYIRKKEMSKAITLAQIEYDERLLKSLQEAKRSFEKYNPTGITEVYEKALQQMSPGKRVLVTPHYISDKPYIEKWRAQEYERLPFRDDSPEYYTRHGLRVRSKSEILIADILDEISIPFLYEKPLRLKHGMVHPDFTLLNIKNRKEIYWEHFGMMDDKEYRDEALMKIREYEANGLYQCDSAIWTFESGKCPMNTRAIRNMIKTLHDVLGY